MADFVLLDPVSHPTLSHHLENQLLVYQTALVASENCSKMKHFSQDSPLVSLLAPLSSLSIQ